MTEYTKAARTSARSISEKIAVAEAVRLNRPQLFLAEPELKSGMIADLAPHTHMLCMILMDEKARATQEVATWQRLIFKQLHIALCTRSKKYTKEVTALKQNARLLIAAIAGYVAASAGVTKAVIAALVAAILRFVLAIGRSAFCERMSVALALTTNSK